MNLYAICPTDAPGNEVELVLAETNVEAMEHGVYAAAKDVADGNYFSPTASVYLVAENLPKVGDARAIDAPKEWTWAHPAVETNLAKIAPCPRCADPIGDHIDPTKGCAVWARGAGGEVLTVD